MPLGKTANDSILIRDSNLTKVAICPVSWSGQPLGFTGYKLGCLCQKLLLLIVV